MTGKIWGRLFCFQTAVAPNFNQKHTLEQHKMGCLLANTSLVDALLVTLVWNQFVCVKSVRYECNTENEVSVMQITFIVFCQVINVKAYEKCLI